MWRFILISFAFLGWSFYVLSGGADYEPRTQSWQARAKLNDVRPLARPARIEMATLPAVQSQAEPEPEVTRAVTRLDDLELAKGNGVTLASLEVPEAAEPEFEADADKTETLVSPEDDPATVSDNANEEPRDMRSVTGTVVNLRDGPSTFYLAIGKLKQGTDVEVLENNGEGWLKIRVAETDQTGWMADWLVTAAAN